MSESSAVGVFEPSEENRPRIKRAEQRTRPRRQPRYHVILWN